MGKAWKGIFVQLERLGGGRKKYDSGLYYDNPDHLFEMCDGKGFRIKTPIMLLPEILGVFRRGKGISPKEMGDAIGRYHKIITDYEEGGRDFTVRDLKYASDKLGLDIEIVLTPKQQQ